MNSTHTFSNNRAVLSTGRSIAAALLLAAAFASPTRVLAEPPAAPASPSSPTAPATGPATPSPAAPKVPEPARSTKDWSLDKSGLAVQGYDPVAYFPEGGGVAAKGLETIALTYKGATYRFATEKNRELFKLDPTKYEPAHGGWCSWAIKDGDKVEVDPKAFIVRDGRLFLFYKGWLGDTRSKWLKEDHAAQAAKADANWKKISGEEARTPASPPAKQP